MSRFYYFLTCPDRALARIITAGAIICVDKSFTRNYKQDTLYPKVVKATARLLQTSDDISPVAILLQMGHLEPKAHEAWCRGQVPYLERVFQGSLSIEANRKF